MGKYARKKIMEKIHFKRENQFKNFLFYLYKLETSLINNNSIGEQRDMDQKQYKKKYITLHKMKVSADQNVDLSILLEILIKNILNKIK